LGHPVNIEFQISDELSLWLILKFEENFRDIQISGGTKLVPNEKTT
jgi:hypothetical protein